MVLAGLLVLGALASASASAALPEFQHGGKALEKTVKFTVTGGTTGVLEGTDGEVLRCLGETMKGETHGTKEVANVVITFKGCDEETGYGACTSAGAGTGEVVSVALSGKLGYLAEAKKVGLLLQPSTGTQIAECSYGKGIKKTFGLKGSVIGRITPVDEERTEPFELKFKKASGHGLQEWTHFEGEETLHTLELTPWGAPKEFVKAALETEKPLTFEEAIEIKA